MKTRRKLTLAVALPAALLALGAQTAVADAPAVASTTTTTALAVSSYPPPTGEIPADWTTLVDDTQTIAIAVPSSWAQADTVPAQNADGTPRPWISASPDLAQFFPAEGAPDTFSVPGVIYTAAPYEPDTAAMLESSVNGDLCTAGPVQAYNDGIFTGHIRTYENCGGTPSRIVEVAAHPSDLSFTATVLVQLTGQADDAGVLNGLLVSFGRVVPPAAG